MNISQGVGDDSHAVAANRNRWLKATGGGVHVYIRQSHGTGIQVLKKNGQHTMATIHTVDSPVDALISDIPGVRLLIQTADCQAVLLFDPEKRVVANIHCGWRGSAANMIGRVVERMENEFGCHPGGMLAAIAPSLGPCCAEFIHYQNELPERLWSYRVGENHFDFWEISRNQLVCAGLLTDRVYVASICTRCNPHLFFSYRTEPRTGRFTSFIALTQMDEK
jgi:YfiH family protein